MIHIKPTQSGHIIIIMFTNNLNTIKHIYADKMTSYFQIEPCVCSIDKQTSYVATIKRAFHVSLQILYFRHFCSNKCN